MNRIDFLKLMKDGLAGTADSDLEILVQSLLRTEKELKKLDERSLDDQAAVMDFLDDMFFNFSKETLARRERIARIAEDDHPNPNCASDYCLHVLKIEFRRWRKKQHALKNSPEKSLVNRQVEDHLRKLREKGLLQSRNVVQCRKVHGTWRRSLLAILWGLSLWGPRIRKRSRNLTNTELIENLPDIPKKKRGKGLFAYKVVLPEYLILILERFGAPLSTAELKSIVLAKTPLTAHAIDLAPISPENEGRMPPINDGPGWDSHESETTPGSQYLEGDEVFPKSAATKPRLLRKGQFRHTKRTK
jgi:hypothetical protein